MNRKEKHIDFKSPNETNSFSVPDNYFDTLNERIMSSVEQSTVSTKTKIIRLIKPLLATAASFIIIFMIVFIPVKVIAPKMADNKITSEQEFIDYYYINDHIVYDTFENKNTETDNNDESMIETMLLASVSEWDLINNEK